VTQTSATSPSDVPAQAHDQDREQPADSAPSESPGFQSRGRARRRARFLRKARELAYRDLGGLVFNLHRFGQRNDALVLAKLTTLGQIDGELRAIEGALGERQSITVLREAGITACPRCAAIHGSEDSFCPNCGLSMGRHVDLPIGGAVAAPPAPPVSPAQADPTAGTPAAPAQPAVAPTPAPASAASAPATPVPPEAPPAAPAGESTGPVAAPAPAVPSAPDEPQTGRSPSPPGTPTTRPPTAAPAPAPAAPKPSVEDGPTEILRPPVSGS
jgi:hypothetical protein